MVDRVRITTSSGRVHVVGEARDDVEVSGAKSSVSGPETVVTGASKPILVRVPAGTDVVVGSASGNVTLDGALGAVSVTTASAGVEAEEVASIDARTASGKLQVGVSHGSVRLNTKSAKVVVGRAEGEVHVAAVSSKVEIGEARDAVTVRTVSGTVEVLLTGSAPSSFETVSGKINVRVPAGVRPDVQLRTVSGKQRVECETGDDIVIVARTVSGKITVASP